MGLQATVAKREWSKEIVVEASRLSMGLWGDKEGDIQAAYCADTFPTKIKTFAHGGHLFTNCGGCIEDAMNCHPLIPAAVYAGPQPRPHTYEGQEAVHKGQAVRLGPQVKFIARDRSPDEWANLLRRQYAHGGYFAAGKTYGEVLEYFAQQSRVSENRKIAIQKELAHPDLPKSQTEMLERLAKEKSPLQINKTDLDQLTLPGL